MIALTHVVSPHISRCELCHLERTAIAYPRACQQHDNYVQALHNLDCQVEELTVNRDYPDSTFIEDTAVVVAEGAVLASMGVASRRAEVAGIATCLAKYRQLYRIEPPATLEGGDVLQVGRHIYVGLSPRTNAAGARALAELLSDWDYQVQALPLQGCLHLKSACTALDAETLLVNPAWIDREALSAHRLVSVPPAEPMAANVLAIGNHVLVADSFPQTADLIRELGFTVITLDISELMKAEAAMTCSSLIFN
jgi:dimethylargininase